MSDKKVYEKNIPQGDGVLIKYTITIDENDVAELRVRTFGSKDKADNFKETKLRLNNINQAGKLR